MTTPVLESRTTALEAAMAELAVAQAAAARSLDRLSREMTDFKREMTDFKDEMALFKDEMALFKDEMAASWERNERARLDDRRDWEQRSAEDRHNWNKRWGELSNRLGTMVEDLVAPSLPRIAEPYLQLPQGYPIETALRVKRRHPADPSRTREVDALCSSPSTWIACEARSRLTARHVSAFAEGLAELREFFPEYADRRLFGCLASLAVEPDVVTFAERCGLLVLAIGDELMDVLNSPGFLPKAF
ncbi:MAG: hypothetical protein KF718_07810 [Polyangiaceae bacterium]|nr:hypothetical protein [Polyangiaceae bacterium]